MPREGIDTIFSNTYTLQLIAYLVTREVLCVLKCQVFEEMSKTLLVLSLLNGSYIVIDIETCLLLKFSVVTNVVG